MRQRTGGAQCSAFAEGNAARSTEKRSRFPCILHSRRVQRHVPTVQAAFSAAPCTPPAKISSKSAVSSGAGAHEAALSFPFSKPRYFSPISKSAVKNSSAESFSQQRRKYSLSSSFSCFSANNSKSHTTRMPHPPCRKCFKLWHKKVQKRLVRAERINFFALHENGFRAQLFMREKGVHVPVRIVFRNAAPCSSKTSGLPGR